MSEGDPEVDHGVSLLLPTGRLAPHLHQLARPIRELSFAILGQGNAEGRCPGVAVFQGRLPASQLGLAGEDRPIVEARK